MQSFKLSLAVLLMASCFGCDRAEMQARESLHELDHVAPPHWPQGLRDASHKMRERLALWQAVETPQEEREQALAELRDLVHWLTEVAADTDLSEAQWMPIYEASERLADRLSQPAVHRDTALHEHVLVLCGLTDQAALMAGETENLRSLEARD